MAALIGILELQQRLAGRDPLDEETQEQQAAQQQQQQQQQQQRPAALPAAQANQQQGTQSPDLSRMHLWHWLESQLQQMPSAKLANLPGPFSACH